jgi:hypothetical protein
MDSQYMEIQYHWGKSPEKSQNIVLMLGTTPFITNDFQVNDELIDFAPNHKLHS